MNQSRVPATVRPCHVTSRRVEAALDGSAELVLGVPELRPSLPGHPVTSRADRSPGAPTRRRHRTGSATPTRNTGDITVMFHADKLGDPCVRLALGCEPDDPSPLRDPGHAPTWTASTPSHAPHNHRRNSHTKQVPQTNCPITCPTPHQAPFGSGVEFVGDPFEAFGTANRKARSCRKILGQCVVGVLVPRRCQGEAESQK
ncbi:hypothetical protein ABH922_000441 [Rhodococcus sp. 27YEA15]